MSLLQSLANIAILVQLQDPKQPSSAEISFSNGMVLMWKWHRAQKIEAFDFVMIHCMQQIHWLEVIYWKLHLRLSSLQFFKSKF